MGIFFYPCKGWGSKGQGKYACSVPVSSKLQDFDEHISILNAELKINQILYQINAQNDQIALVAKFSKNLLWHARSELPIFRHQLIVIGINAHDLVENDFVNMKIRQVTLTFKVNMIIYKINLSSCSEKL